MKVHLLRSLQPICFNMDKWNVNNSPLLLITGLSGSGKTTFAQKFAKHHHAICVSFDVLKFYPESSKQSKKIFTLFLKNYPQIKKYVSIRWKKTDQVNSNDILFNCNLFFDFLIDYSLQCKKKIVLEGIQLFVRLNPSKSAQLPVIIIRSSSIHSFCNKIKRDYYPRKFLPSRGVEFLKHIIMDIHIYYIKHLKLLNTYIEFLSTLHKNKLEGD